MIKASKAPIRYLLTLELKSLSLYAIGKHIRESFSIIQLFWRRTCLCGICVKREGYQEMVLKTQWPIFWLEILRLMVFVKGILTNKNIELLPFELQGDSYFPGDNTWKGLGSHDRCSEDTLTSFSHNKTWAKWEFFGRSISNFK